MAYLARWRGGSFEGQISAVTLNGLTVTLDELGIRVTVERSQIDGGDVSFARTKRMLVARRSGRVFSLGNRITVELIAVSEPQCEAVVAPVTSASLAVLAAA